METGSGSVLSDFPVKRLEKVLFPLTTEFIAWDHILHRSFWEMQELMCCAAPVAEKKCSCVDEHFPGRTDSVIKVSLQEIGYQVSA